jgi:hypothetical protein
MELHYKVISVTPRMELAKGTVNGVEQVVEVLEIDVLLHDPSNGHLKFHFNTPDQRRYALKTFVPGQDTTVTLPPEGNAEIDNELPGIDHIDNELPEGVHIDHALPTPPDTADNTLPTPPAGTKPVEPPPATTKPVEPGSGQIDNELPETPAPKA